ncbi:MAG: ComF family protein [Gammaproteobacteria bacterium]
MTCQPVKINRVNNWLDIIQHYLLPPTCILCGNPGRDSMDICRHCTDLLPRNNNCCYRCGAIYEQMIDHPLLCGDCQKRKMSFDETHAPFTYQGVIRYLITGLKFRSQFKNARLLGMLMAEHLKLSAECPEYLLPVPLHKSRYRQRGFNQAIEIAQTLGRELSIPLSLNGCTRIRNTPHQIDLPAKQRRKNIKHAFSIHKLPPARHVAIVDDVMTTGTTVAELAALLKKAGVDRVDVWVCARA